MLIKLYFDKTGANRFQRVFPTPMVYFKLTF